jgi:Carbohydrate family 9 binding domain-like
MYWRKTKRFIKRRDFFFVLAILALAMTRIHPSGAQRAGIMNQTSPYQSNLEIESHFLSEDFIPDGDLGKDIWQQAAWVRFDHDMTGSRNFPQSETEVAARWTATQLYFAFRCRFSTLNVYADEDTAKEKWELWNRDVVEVFINPQPGHVNHYYEFEVSPNNQWIDLEIDKDKTPFNDPGWNSGFLHSTRIDAAHQLWLCEMRIPVGPMGVEEIRGGAEWRINFYRADGPGEGPSRRLMSWSTIPEGRTFHVPTRFAIIRFVK